jgi:hypothetical protein
VRHCLVIACLSDVPQYDDFEFPPEASGSLLPVASGSLLPEASDSRGLSLSSDPFPQYDTDDATLLGYRSL